MLHVVNTIIWRHWRPGSTEESYESHGQTNEEVYCRMNTHTSLVLEIVYRQLSLLGHGIQKYDLQCLVVTGIVNGKRAKGRPRETYLSKMMNNSFAFGDHTDGEEEIYLVKMVCAPQPPS